MILPLLFCRRGIVLFSPGGVSALPPCILIETGPNSSTEKNFIISCDMPLISVELIKYLINFNFEKSILLPKSNERIQQLCGIYSKSVIDEIENIFKLSEKNKNIKGSVYELLEIATVEFIDIDDLKFYNKNIFLNMNSPEDYELIKNIYEKR